MTDTGSEPRDEGVPEASETSTAPAGDRSAAAVTQEVQVDDGTDTAPSPPPIRRLTRRTDRRVLGGVASGLAAYFGIDPLIVRLGLVAFLFATGPLAVLLYLIAWAVIPADPHSGPAGNGRTPVWLWVVIALAALLVIGPAIGALFSLGNGPWGGPWDGPGFGDQGFPAFMFGFWRPGVFWAIVLIGIGVVLFRRSDQARDPVAPGDAPAVAAGAGPGTAAWSPPPSRTPSILGRLTAAAALLVAGIAALIDNLGLVNVGPRAGLALVLVVVGLGLLVGALWGTARWLIPIGLLLIPVLFVTGWAGQWGPGFGRDWGRGEFPARRLQPTSLSEVADPIRLDTGALTIDLTELPLSPTPARVEASVGAGAIEVLVPPDAGVDVNARVGAGDVDILGEQRDGAGLDVDVTEAGTPNGGQLALDLQAGFGEIVVREVPAQTPAQSQEEF